MKIKTIEIPFEIKEVDDKGVFSGVASTFGGKPDSHGDVIAEGAFSETIAKGGRNGNGIAMLWQHDVRQPIGKWNEITEKKRSLNVIGQLILGVQKADEAYLLMKNEALKGLSIGYDTIVEEWDDKKKINTLKKVDLWEISPVTFPANVRANITQVKESDIKEMLNGAQTVREVEKILRDAGFSKSVSKMVCSWWKSARCRETDAKRQLLDSLKNINESFK